MSLVAPRIAFVHDWLVTFGGGEQVLGALLEIWPEASIYTLVHDPGGPCAGLARGRELHTSFIQRLPGAKRNHRRYLPLMPLAIEQLDLSPYDLVLSCSHAVAKGVLTHAGQLHISYILTPIRYAWDLQGQYLRESHLDRGLRGLLARLLLHYVRLWDLNSSARVDTFIAISRFTARRVEKLYRRQADVIYPPVDVATFQPCLQKDDFYLTAARLVPYKKVDLIVEAFNRMPGRRLVVIGDGPEKRRLEKLASTNITFLGFQSQASIVQHMQRARAFVFAAHEDFGIVPLEAQACSTPVIAYGRGGALETVLPGETGLFFDQQTPESLIQAVEDFEHQRGEFDRAKIRLNAERFGKERFKQEMRDAVETRWKEFAEQNQ